MNIQIILLIFGLSQIFANNTTNKAINYPDGDYGELMFKNVLTKLDEILTENQEINKNLMNLKKRLEAQEIVQKNIEASMYREKFKQNQGEWTVIQRRQDGSVNFNRSWLDYKKGFGWPNGDFFIGLEKLHALTTRGATQELWIVLKDFENETRYAIYDKFVVGSEAEKYSLKELGSYRGTAGDNLMYHKGLPFSTPDNGICANRYEGGWWYIEFSGKYELCYACNLNGPYLKGINPTGGAAWGAFHDWNYSLQFVEMMIRSI